MTPDNDLTALTQAMEALTRTTQTWEEAYRHLQEQIRELDRELAEKNRELALTTEYLGGLLESMSDGVIAVDDDGRVTRFNRAAGVILGYTAEEVAGRPFPEIFGRDFAAPTLPGAMRLQTKSGRMVPVAERDSDVADRSGRRCGRVKTFQDLSEMVALREQVRQMDRLAAIGEMAATVAHEIRNPLGGIRGFASFLARDIPETDPKRRLVDKILQGTASLDRVVGELLEYTRPVELHLRPAHLEDIVSSALGLLAHELEFVSLERKETPDLKLLADPDKMRQVLLNVLINALQSMAGAGTIVLGARADGNHVVVSIQDTGCGMDAAQVAKVCSPFYTTKEKGTGLGMAVCQKIIDGHGGHLAIESEVGVGTTVSLRLPRAE